MIIDTSITLSINEQLKQQDYDERENHISSKQLTASYLKEPKRFQLLKYLGVPTKQSDEFGLRKFARGRQVEDYFIDKLDKMGILEHKQRTLEYREVIGIVDSVIDTDKMQIKKGLIPNEIKSVTNRNYKWIHDKGDISWHYHMQAGLYALAYGSNYYGLSFIASDDLREYVTFHETKNIKGEVDKAINEYNVMITQWNKGLIVPDWEVHDKWQDNPMYMKYDEFWATCSSQEFINKVKELNI